MIRVAAAALVLLSASGCLAGPAPTVPPATAPTSTGEGALPFHASGRLWLPESGQTPARANITFPVNASTFVVTAHVRISASLGAADAPTTISTVTVSLADPSGKVLDKATHQPGPATAHDLKADAGGTGTFALVFDCQTTGGGAGTGDYADYEIKAS
jgi:hypothetical protein